VILFEFETSYRSGHTLYFCFAFYFGNVTFRLNGPEKAKVFAPSIQAVSWLLSEQVSAIGTVEAIYGKGPSLYRLLVMTTWMLLSTILMAGTIHSGKHREKLTAKQKVIRILPCFTFGNCLHCAYYNSENSFALVMKKKAQNRVEYAE
jgi:hypothetical protein